MFNYDAEGNSATSVIVDAAENAEISPSGENENVFIITYDEYNQIDKTFEEAKQAYLSGSIIMFKPSDIYNLRSTIIAQYVDGDGRPDYFNGDVVCIDTIRSNTLHLVLNSIKLTADNQFTLESTGYTLSYT